MPAMMRICGRKPTIAIWPMCSPSKARSRRRLPTSCRRNFHLTRRKPSSSRPPLTWRLSTFTAGRSHFSSRQVSARCTPDNAETRAIRGLVYLFWKADTRPLHQTIDAILAQGPGAIVSAAVIWFACALAERDPAAAERALVALGDNPCLFERGIILNHSFGEGLLARMNKDEARAGSAFETARAQQEKIVQAQPDYGPALCALGLIDAALR